MEQLTAKQEKWAKEMKLKALDMAFGTGSLGAHIGGGFSAMEIYSVLYSGILNVGKNSLHSDNRDRIIASKGHGVLAQYTALWEAGLLTEEELDTFDKNGTHFYGHPCRNLDKGIEFSAGSLGLGISFGVGVALSCKNKGLDNRIVIVIGDGECNEGIVWEAIMTAVNYQLSNLTLIVDRNKYQLDGPTDEIMKMSPLENIFKTFGLAVDVVNGHDCEELTQVIEKRYDMPNVIIADTIKAHGISFLENNKMSHQCSITKKQYEQAKTELENGQ